MVVSAMQLGLPAVRQSAAYPILAEETLDAVIFAYGTHHLPQSQRPLALANAFRMLKPGGRVIVQDFEVGTPTARWYSEVLDTYTETGHPCSHFTRAGLLRLVDNAGFVDVKLMNIYDPCITHADTPHAAKIKILAYLVDLFALKIPRGTDGDLTS
jgi:hypothetical protein